LASRSFTFIDPGRSTFDYTTGKRIDRRSLGVEFLYLTKAGVADRITPDAPIERRMAYPLVLFAPGYRLRTANYTTLLEAWVRAGFLVASISFPDTTYPASDVPYSAHLPYGLPEGDLYNQPGDVAFLLGKLNASAQGGAWYDGLVDPHRIVLAGHSDGGSTVAALVYDSAAPHTSVAVRGVVVLSGSEFPISGQTYAQPSSGEVPLLVVQGTADRCSPPAGAIGLYDAIGAEGPRSPHRRLASRSVRRKRADVVRGRAAADDALSRGRGRRVLGHEYFARHGRERTRRRRALEQRARARDPRSTRRNRLPCGLSASRPRALCTPRPVRQAPELRVLVCT
jgi:hypothetical protein